MQLYSGRQHEQYVNTADLKNEKRLTQYVEY